MRSSSSKGGGGGSGSTTLNGSGSTFQQTFDQTAIAAFQDANKGITINYAGGGSGKGKTDLQSKTVDFAGTDSLVKDADVSKYQGGKILYFPIAAAPITVSFHVNGVDSLQLSGETLAKIFSGTIKKWNDAAIENDNGDATLPSHRHRDRAPLARHPARRATSRSTSPTRAAATGRSAAATRSTGRRASQAGQGNAGVAQAISSTDGAIGYVDFSDASQAKLKFASIENKAGKFLAPTLAGASAAVASSTIAADLTYSPLNQAGADAYPITSPTWILVYANQTDHAKGTALKSFLTFILNDGQGLAESVNYAKLPTSLQQKAIAQFDQHRDPRVAPTDDHARTVSRTRRGRTSSAPSGKAGGKQVDRMFRAIAFAAGLLVLAILALIAYTTTSKAWPAFTHQGLSFFTSTHWNPNDEQLRCARLHLRHDPHRVHRDLHRDPRESRHRALHHRARAQARPRRGRRTSSTCSPRSRRSCTDSGRSRCSASPAQARSTPTSRTRSARFRCSGTSSAAPHRASSFMTAGLVLAVMIIPDHHVDQP